MNGNELGEFNGSFSGQTFLKQKNANLQKSIRTLEKNQFFREKREQKLKSCPKFVLTSEHFASNMSVLKSVVSNPSSASLEDCSSVLTNIRDMLVSGERENELVNINQENWEHSLAELIFLYLNLGNQVSDSQKLICLEIMEEVVNERIETNTGIWRADRGKVLLDFMHSGSLKVAEKVILKGSDLSD